MRFRVEERSGIVAVYDTAHPEYQDTPGCHADYPWTVCSWHGAFDEKAGHWNVDQRWVDKARAACELLNTLSANATGERTRNPLGGRMKSKTTHGKFYVDGQWKVIEKKCATCCYVRHFDKRPDEPSNMGCTKQGWEGYTHADEMACGGCFYFPNATGERPETRSEREL